MSGKQSSRKFGGLLTKKEVEEEIRKLYPDAPKGEIKLRVKLELLFQKKHLEAYLRGDNTFDFGKDKRGKTMRFEVEDGRKEEK